MGYSLIPFFLMIGFLAVVIAIIIRKFPQVSLLDVENLPEVKEEKKKDEYLKKKVEERSRRTKMRIREFFSSRVLPQMKNIQTSFRALVRKTEQKALSRMQEKKKRAPLSRQYVEQGTLQHLLSDARQALLRKEFESAERGYIAVIRADAKNADAYNGLADVYSAQGQAKEAKETYQFVLQLRPQDEHAIVRLAEIAEQEGNKELAVQWYEQAVLLNDHVVTRFVKIAELLTALGQYDTALEAVRQAVELEPQNPKYLDMLVEISILTGNHDEADAAYQALRMVNPDNQKLPALRDKISRMAKVAA